MKQRKVYIVYRKRWWRSPEVIGVYSCKSVAEAVCCAGDSYWWEARVIQSVGRERGEQKETA